MPLLVEPFPLTVAWELQDQSEKAGAIYDAIRVTSAAGQKPASRCRTRPIPHVHALPVDVRNSESIPDTHPSPLILPQSMISDLALL